MREYISSDLMKSHIDNYFDQVKAYGKFNIDGIEYEEEFPTITGLALFLGFSSVSSLTNLCNNPNYSDVIEYAKLRIENRYEKLLQKGVVTAKVALNKLGEWREDTNINHNFTFADMVAKAAKANRISDEMMESAKASVISVEIAKGVNESI